MGEKSKIKYCHTRGYKMTYYETLKNKADECRKAARKTKGFMRKVWLNHAARLELMAGNLPVIIANNKVE